MRSVLVLFIVLAMAQRAVRGNEPIVSERVQQRTDVDHLLICPGGVHAVAFSPCGRFLVAGSSARQREAENDELMTRKCGFISIWSTKSFDEIVPTVQLPGNGSVFDIAFSGDGQSVAAAHQGVTTIDIPTGRIDRRYDVEAGARYAVALSEDGRILVAGGPEYDVRVIAMGTGQLLHSLRGGVPQPSGRISPLERLVTTVAVSGDNRYVAAGDALGTDVWEIGSGKHVHRIRGSQGAAWSTRFGVRRAGELLGLGAVSPNQREQNNELGAGAWVGLWDVERNKLMRRFEIPEVWVDGTAYSADGRLLAMASSFPLAVRLVDTDTNELITNMMTTTRSLACAVALSPFGDIVAIGSPDRRVRIWRLQHDGKRWP